MPNKPSQPEPKQSVFADAYDMLTSMQGEQAPTLPGTTDQFSDIPHYVATVLGSVEKGVHLLGHHAPRAVDVALKGTEILADIIHDDCEDHVEQFVAGTASAVTKIATGTMLVSICGAALVAGGIVAPEVEIPLLVETVVGGSLGATTQQVMDQVINPAGDAVAHAVHKAFELAKNNDKKPTAQAHAVQKKVTEISHKTRINIDDLSLKSFPSPAMSNFIQMLDGEKHPPTKSSGLVVARANHAAQQAERAQTEMQMIRERDATAKLISEQFHKNGDIQALYTTYQQNKNMEQFLQNVDQVCASQKLTNAWCGFGDKAVSFSQELARLLGSEGVASFAQSTAGVMQSVHGYREFSNGLSLLQNAKGIEGFLGGFEGMLGGAGMLMSAVSLISSVFGSKKKASPDYSAATYSAVMAMWQEMREGFRDIKETNQRNFETTWVKLGWMDTTNAQRFYALYEAVEKNHVVLMHSLQQKNEAMHDRFNYVDWKLERIADRARIDAVSTAFTTIMTTSNTTLTPADTKAECDKKLYLLLDQFNSTGSQQEKFSGLRVGEASSSDHLQYAVSLLDHPVFSLTTLGSYLNVVLPYDQFITTRSQMSAAMRDIQHDDITFYHPMGLEHFIKTASRELPNLWQALQNNAAETVIIPLDFGGSWILLARQRLPQLSVVVMGLAAVVEQCAMQLMPLLDGALLITAPYPENISAHQTGNYCSDLMRGFSEEKIDLAQLIDTQETPVAEEHHTVATMPTPDEQEFGNPLIDWWLSLHLQRTIALHYDSKNTPLASMPEILFKKITAIIKNNSAQSQLLTRAQNPDLFKQLIDDYRRDLAAFDAVYEPWAQETAERISKDENAAIRVALLEMDGMVSPLHDHQFGSRVKPKVDYPGSKWWVITYHWQNVCARYGHGDGWKSRTSTDEAQIETRKMTYLQRVGQGHTDAIQEQLQRLETAREKLKPNHDLTPAILAHGTIETYRGTFSPLCLVPIAPRHPYLAAPDHLQTLIPETLHHAYQCAQIQLRFSYEIDNNIFRIKGEWREKLDNSWEGFTVKEYNYDALFYEGEEAILGFWYGGNMPLDQNASDCMYSQGYTGRQPTVDCVQWHWHIALPNYQARSAALTIDIRSLPEKIPAAQQTVNEAAAQQLIDAWSKTLSIKLAQACVRDMQNATTPLAKAAAKIQQDIHLLKSYLNFIEFSYQETVFESTQDVLQTRLFNRDAMLHCLQDPQRGIAAFDQLKPSQDDIDHLEETIITTVQELSACGLMTPLSKASLLLHEIIRDRLPGKRLPNLNMRVRTLDGYIASMRGQIEELCRRSGDAVYNRALREAMHTYNREAARLNGELDALQKSENEDFNAVADHQTQIFQALQRIDRTIYSVNTLVQTDVLSPDTLTMSQRQQTQLQNLFETIDHQLADSAEEFNTVYVAKRYTPPPNPMRALNAPVVTVAGFFSQQRESRQCNQATYATTVEKLRALEDQKTRLHAWLQSTDNEGNTILHRACFTADFELVQLLLSYNPQLDGINTNRQTAEACIPNTKQGDKIKLLLDIHKNTLQEAQHTGIALHRTLFLMSEAIKTLNPRDTIEAPAVLFYGCTGVGKSTFINFLKGCSYEAQESKTGKPIRVKIQGNDLARVGQSLLSETIFPAVYAVENRPYVFVDMPGIHDNRENEDETALSPYDITAAVCTHLLSKKLQHITAIVVLCTEDHFSDARALALQTIFRQVGRMIKDNPDLKQNIVLGVTKQNRLKLTHVLENLNELSAGFADDADMAAFLAVFAGADGLSLITFVDVINDDFRNDFLNRLNNLSVKPSADFNFQSYSKHIVRFKELLMRLNAERAVLSDHIQQLIQSAQDFKSDEKKAERDRAIIDALNHADIALGEFVAMKALLGVQEKMLEQLNPLMHENGFCQRITKIEADADQQRNIAQEIAALHLKKAVMNDFYRGLDGIVGTLMTLAPATLTPVDMGTALVAHYQNTINDIERLMKHYLKDHVTWEAEEVSCKRTLKTDRAVCIRELMADPDFASAVEKLKTSYSQLSGFASLFDTRCMSSPLQDLWMNCRLIRAITSTIGESNAELMSLLKKLIAHKKLSVNTLFEAIPQFENGMISREIAENPLYSELVNAIEQAPRMTPSINR